MMKRFTGWQIVALAGIIVPSACLLLYGLVRAGENIAGIAAAVGAILAAFGWQASRTKAQIEEVRNDVGKVEKLANGNLTREVELREMAQRMANEQMHAMYQQALQLAAAAPAGTVVPPPVVAVPVVFDSPAEPANGRPATVGNLTDRI